MNQRYETSWVSTHECVINKIKNETPQPVGIVFCGVDCEFKNQVVDACLGDLYPIAYGAYDMSTDGKMKFLLSSEGERVAVNLDATESANRETRLTAVQRLFDAGATNVIGIWIGPQSCTETPDSPAADEFSYLVEVYHVYCHKTGRVMV